MVIERSWKILIVVPVSGPEAVTISLITLLPGRKVSSPRRKLCRRTAFSVQTTCEKKTIHPLAITEVELVDILETLKRLTSTDI